MNAIEEAIALALEASLKRGRGPDPGPFAQYYDDPVGFAKAILGVEPWVAHPMTDRKYGDQASVMRALISSNRVTVRSGHSVGKTRLAAMLVLWFAMTRGPGCRVILTATKAKQAEDGVWREMRILYLRAKMNLQALGWVLPKLGATGLQGPEMQQVIVLTSDTAEGFQGMHAPEMMIIADEASGIDERIFLAMDGNLADSEGSKFLLIGNPTKAEGYFWESHRSTRWVQFHIPSTATPNAMSGKRLVPGIADREWCMMRLEAYGAESADYKIRVLGEFVEQQEGKLFTPEMIKRAEDLWPDTAKQGRITVGIDPAGDGGEGDCSAFIARRGAWISPPYTRVGLSAEMHVLEALGMVAMHGRDHDAPRFIIDVSGVPGSKVYAAFLAYLGQHAGAFDVIPVRPSDPAKRRPLEVDKMRDELWFNLVDAFREGLAIPNDLRLEGDLGVIRFDRMNAGRAKVLSKPAIRRALGRSPDIGDALTLACYEPVDWSEQIEAQIRAADQDPGPAPAPWSPGEPDGGGPADVYGGAAVDPYAGAPGGEGWRRR